MTTIPSRLARAATTSPDLLVARKRARTLYRDWYRSAPEICAVHALPVPPAYIREGIRREFERNKHVEDVRVLDVLLLKGRSELQETLNGWKQPSHILGSLVVPKERPRQSFLEKFYAGRDEEGIIPAATPQSH